MYGYVLSCCYRRYDIFLIFFFGMLVRAVQKLGQLSRLGDMNQGPGYMFLPPKEHLLEKVFVGNAYLDHILFELSKDWL